MQSPVYQEQVTLDVTMAAEIPRFYSGTWATSKALNIDKNWNSSFNETIPTINGPVRNDIYPETNEVMFPLLSRYFDKNSSLVDVVNGCPKQCKAKLIAPAVKRTCITHEIPVNYNEPMDAGIYAKLANSDEAPPLNRQYFVIASSLVEGVNETMNLVRGQEDDMITCPSNLVLVNMTNLILVSKDHRVQHHKRLRWNIHIQRLHSGVRRGRVRCAYQRRQSRDG
jgi:hypothetical protein